MTDNEQGKRIRDFMRRLRRNPTDQQLERILAIRTKLEGCDLTIVQQMSFRLMVQGWKEIEATEIEAQDSALIELSILIDDGELEIIDNAIVLSESGQRWLQQQQAKGMGKSN